MAHLKVLNNKHLCKGEEEEPANYDKEVPSPQIVHIKRETGLDVIRSADGAQSWLSTTEGASLVGPNDIGVLVHARVIPRNDE